MKNKTAIIIGASTGIGAETALLLSKSFENIAITSSKHEAELLAVKNAILANGAKCYAQVGDASDFEFMKGFISNVTKEFGEEISLLVNNAGISYVGLLTDMTPADWRRTMDVNVTSMFNSCHAVVPHMVKNRCGRIINISSVWGNVGASCEVAYSASKGAVNAFTKALGKELAPSNVQVNAIAFGAVDTTMNGHLSDEEKADLAEEIPAGKMATPESAAIFIKNIYEMPDYLTGQVITFDGGWT